MAKQVHKETSGKSTQKIEHQSIRSLVNGQNETQKAMIDPKHFMLHENGTQTTIEKRDSATSPMREAEPGPHQEGGNIARVQNDAAV